MVFVAFVLLVGNSLKINPILVIFEVTVGGAYFGLIGMFLAVPIIAIMKVLIEDFIDYRERKKKLNELDNSEEAMEENINEEIDNKE